MRTLFAALVALALLSAPAKADIVEEVLGCKGDPCIVKENPGGKIKKFVEAATAIALGDRSYVIIDGECASACTVLIDLIRNKVCLISRAKLEFHRGTRSVSASVVMFPYTYKELIDLNYSREVDAWIRWKGGLPRDGSFITMPIGVAQTIWSPCLPKGSHSVHGLY